MSGKKGMGPNRTVFFPVIAVMVLGSMLWDIVSAYIKGGEDAPSVLVLVIACVVLGGGVEFSAFQSYRTWKALNEEQEKKAQEKAEEAAKLEQAQEDQE